MTRGHFIWIWTDTSADTEFFDQVVLKPEFENQNLDLISLMQRKSAAIDAANVNSHYHTSAVHHPGGGGAGGGSGSATGGGMSVDSEDTMDNVNLFSLSNNYDDVLLPNVFSSFDNNNKRTGTGGDNTGGPPLYINPYATKINKRSIHNDSDKDDNDETDTASADVNNVDAANTAAADTRDTLLRQNENIATTSSHVLRFVDNNLFDTKHSKVDFQLSLKYYNELTNSSSSRRTAAATGRDRFAESLARTTSQQQFNNAPHDDNIYNVNNNYNNDINDNGNFNNNNDNVNDNNNNNQKSQDDTGDRNDKRAKRTTLLTPLNLDNTDVMFHNFEEFPMGLLALRPIKMAVDRNFITSTIRLFAKAWMKLDDRPDSIFSQKRKRAAAHDHQQHHRQDEEVVPNSINIDNNNDNTSTTNRTSGLFTKKNTSKSNISFLNSSSISSLSNKFTPTKNDTELETKSTIKKRQDTWWFKQRMDMLIDHGPPEYKEGCYGSPTEIDVIRAKEFHKQIRADVRRALLGESDPLFKTTLTSQFEILNLVPMDIKHDEKMRLEPYFERLRFEPNFESTARKWRRVGLITGKQVQLDTIVWPGGDIVVSGATSQPRSMFRIVTALAPPFVMRAEADVNGQCLRGLQCQEIVKLPDKQNVTLIFNSVGVKGRTVNEQDVEDYANRQHMPQNNTQEVEYR